MTFTASTVVSGDFLRKSSQHIPQLTASQPFSSWPLREKLVSFSTHHQHFRHQMWGVFHTTQLSNACMTPTGCPTIYNSDTNCLEFAQTLQVKGSIPQGWPPFPPTSDTNCKSQVVTCASNWLQTGSSHDPSLKFSNLLERLTEFQKTVYLLIHQFTIQK